MGSSATKIGVGTSGKRGSDDVAFPAAGASVVIRPSGKLSILDLGELWYRRELLYLLAWRDISVRYKQTVLGAAWAILQPFLTMVVFTIFFGHFAKMPSDGIPYPIFAYAGLLPWTFFSNAVNNSSDSLVGSSSLITKVYFPRMVIPGAAVLAAFVDFAIGSLVLFGMMALYGLRPNVGVLILPLLVALTMAAALGVGLWLSALNVKYRDVRYAVPFLIQLGLYVTPIIYPVTIVPPKWRWLLALNPLTGIIEGYRSALLGMPFYWNALAASVVTIAALLVYAGFSFGRMERQFADII